MYLRLAQIVVRELRLRRGIERAVQPH
jgi:hypothetical protein